MRFNTPLIVFLIVLLANASAQDAVKSSKSSGARPVPGKEIIIQAVGEKEKEYKPRITLALDQWPGAATLPADTGFDKYGGLMARPHASNGYFRVEKVGDRWIFIDPEGHEFYDVAVAGVRPNQGEASKQALQAKFGNLDNWAKETTALLRKYSFNGTGGWSDDAILSKTPDRPVYTVILSFMSTFAKNELGARMGTGHMKFQNDCVPVFHPKFEAFCEDYAKEKIEPHAGDPYLLGYFSDNELTFVMGKLVNYLQLPEGDSGHDAAWAWLRDRHGKDATAAQVTLQDEKDFTMVVLERYYRIVSAAIKRHDPNHLFLGSRFFGKDRPVPEVFRACGPYCDVVSVNWYNTWTPSEDEIGTWTKESGRPILVTEYYAKGMDSGLGNKSGAGFLVHTQKERGLFYQNFTLALLRSKNCVGWHWFRYADNDPRSAKEDPSNLDSNKGIVNMDYQPYQTLLDMMKPVNERVFALMDYFDGKKVNN
jgi:hypothetical protein